MKARLLKQLLNDTEYQVADHGEYVAVGSALCHNLISVNKATLEMAYALDTFGKGRDALGNVELVAIWDKLHELIASGDIQDIIEGQDDIANPLPVYTADDGQIIESTTDAYGWPNVTADGKMMYDNTYFKTKKEAVEYGIIDLAAGISLIDGDISRLKKNLDEKRKQRNLYNRQLIDVRNEQ